MSRLTKRRAADGWEVLCDRKPTGLAIQKGLIPRYREPQMYDVILGDDDWLFEAKSVGRAIDVLEALATVFLGEPST